MAGKRRTGGVSISRKRGTLDGVFEATFRDPRRWQDPKNPAKGRKVVRKSLRTNDLETAKRYQAALKRLIEDPSLWEVPPDDIPLVVREIWLGARADMEVKTKKGTVRLPWSKNAKRPATLQLNVKGELDEYDGEEWPGLVEVKLPYTEDAKTLTLAEAYQLAIAELDHTRRTVERLAAELRDMHDEKTALELKLRQYNRRAAKAAKVGTLEQEAVKYLEDYNARKITQKRKGIMKSTINTFVEKLGKARKADDISEADVSRYVQAYKDADGKAIGEERRKSIRLAVCTFMESITDGTFDRKRVKRVSSHAVEREKRNPIYLEPHEVTQLLSKLKELHGMYWHDFATIQVFMGWRPTELALLQKENVSGSHIELVPIKDEVTGVWHAKTGRRSVQIHDGIREAIERRLSADSSRLLFPFQSAETSQAKRHKRKLKTVGILADAWTQDHLSKQYSTRLREAAERAELSKPIDSRTLRRTFGSLCIRSGLTVEQTSVLMGNRPGVVRAHYGRLTPDEVSLAGVQFIQASGTRQGGAVSNLDA